MPRGNHVPASYTLLRVVLAAPGEHVGDRHFRLVDLSGGLGRCGCCRGFDGRFFGSRRFLSAGAAAACGLAGGVGGRCCARCSTGAGGSKHVGNAHLGAVDFGGSAALVAGGGRRRGLCGAVPAAEAASPAGFGAAALPPRAAARISATDGFPGVRLRLLFAAGVFAAGWLAASAFAAGFFASGFAAFGGGLSTTFKNVGVDVVPADVQVVIHELHQRPAAHVYGLHLAHDVAKPRQLRPRCVHHHVLVRVLALLRFDLLDVTCENSTLKHSPRLRLPDLSKPAILANLPAAGKDECRGSCSSPRAQS